MSTRRRRSSSSTGTTSNGSRTRAATRSTRGSTPCCRGSRSTPRNRRPGRVATLSGGERGRVGLAAQLVAPADLLLLDEPTNHLDLETTAWLQEYLRELDETVIVISHDRAFLDEIADHVLHLEGGTAETYRGGYSSFVQQRAERRLALERQVDQQRKMIAKEEDYIRRNIAGQNTAQAKGRRKRLDRLPRLTPPPGAGGTMELRLEISERGGDRVISAEALTVAIGDRTLVRDFSATANRGDVIALVGPNGAGKTTLIKTLLGEREPQGGAVQARRLRHARVLPAGSRQAAARCEPVRSDREPPAALDARRDPEPPRLLRLLRRGSVPFDAHALRAASARGSRSP